VFPVPGLNNCLKSEKRNGKNKWQHIVKEFPGAGNMKRDKIKKAHEKLQKRIAIKTAI